MNDIYAPRIPGHLRLAAKCTHDFLKSHGLPPGHFDEFFGVAQESICPYLSDDCESLSIDHGLVWNHLWGRLTTHHQRLKLIHIPPSTRHNWVKKGKQFEDPEVGTLKPDMRMRCQLKATAVLEFIRSLDPEFLAVRYNGSSHPNHPDDAAAKLGLSRYEFEKRQKELEARVCEAFDIPLPTGYRRACPPESNVAQEEGGSRVA